MRRTSREQRNCLSYLAYSLSPTFRWSSSPNSDFRDAGTARQEARDRCARHKREGAEKGKGSSLAGNDERPNDTSIIEKERRKKEYKKKTKKAEDMLTEKISTSQQQ